MSDEPKKVQQPETDTKSKEALPEEGLDQVVGGVTDFQIQKLMDKSSPKLS
jgi:hypothetical protein